MKKKDIIKNYDSVIILESSHPSPLSANKTSKPFHWMWSFYKNK